MQEVLDQVFKLASGSRRSKDLALVGLQDEISNASAKLQRLRTGLEVGRVSQTVEALKQTKKDSRKEISSCYPMRRRRNVVHPLALPHLPIR